MAGNVKTKQKRTKLTLDRLLSIKKYITDSLSVLAKHDKASCQIDRNNTVPKGTGKTVYKKFNDSDKCAASSLYPPSNTPRSEQYTPECYLQEVSYVPNAQNLMQRVQTWPHDEYSTHKLEDQFSNHNQTRFHLDDFETPSLESVTSHCGKQGRVAQHNSTQTITAPSVKHQAIQTDTNDELDINADIIRYLSQFNDKIAFSLCAPTVVRRSGNGYPYCYEQDYCLYSNAHNYAHRCPTRLSPRRPEEYVQLPKSDCYAQDIVYRPLYDPSPSLTYHEQTRQYGLGTSSDLRGQQAFEKGVSNTSDFMWTKKNHSMAHSRIDTRVSSEDSGSILSSEADSDFMFYPCSSLTQNLQCMTMIDSRSSNILSQPSDLPQNVSTRFSWRAGFCGSSLDEVTLQFFLDEDALSDDVFLDENGHMTPADDNDEHADNETALESASMYSRLYNICPQSCQGWVSSSGDETGFRDSYGDNCYAYRYADIDEVLNNYITEDQPYKINESNAGELSPELAESGCIPASNSSDTHCNVGDFHLEFSDEFSNVLDSLRRNSTQTKARRMWRQRRAKAKKNSKLYSNNNNRGQSNIPECQPAFFTFDHTNMLNHNGNFPPKPLRGILKNKECTSLEGWECGSKQQPGDAHSSVDSTAACPTMFMLDSRPLPGSPCVYASVHKRLNHTIKLSSVDEVVEVTTESAFDQSKDHSHLEVNSTGSETSGPSHQLNDDINSNSMSSRQHEPEDQQISPPVNYNSDDFHILLSPEPDGQRKIFALRKNSIEAYEWTRSLQRRHRKKVRRAKCCQICPKSNECQIALHQNGLTSSI